MHTEQLLFLPFPTSRDGTQHDGVLLDAPAKCVQCSARDCDAAKAVQLGVCRYGFNYLRMSDKVVINGILVRSWQPQAGPWSKNARRLRTHVLAPEVLDRVCETFASAQSISDADLQARKDLELAKYRASSAFEADSVSLLKPDLQQSLSQVHDYRQLVTQIVQNVNVLLDARQAGDLERKLDEAPREIQAIYWSARLMETKLTAALYLMYPERINERSKIRKFRLHGMVTKYEKIYEGAFEDRSVRVRFAGQSYGDVRGNPEAVDVIPHTLIDNALKYSPPDSEVVLEFEEDEHEIALAVTSEGPRIEDDELKTIFGLFVRGRAAAATHREGTGFGLALAKIVADELGISLSVHQDPRAVSAGYYTTTFTAVFPRAEA